jgi:hypothetical protein
MEQTDVRTMGRCRECLLKMDGIRRFLEYAVGN